MERKNERGGSNRRANELLRKVIGLWLWHCNQLYSPHPPALHNIRKDEGVFWIGHLENHICFIKVKDDDHLWRCTFDAYFWTIPSGADGSIMDAFASAFGLTLPRIIVKWRKRPKSSLSFEGVQTWKYWYFEASDCCWEKYFSNLGLGLLTKTSPSNLFTRVFYFPSSKQWLWFPWTNKVSLFFWKPIWFQRLRLIWLSGKYLSN